MTGIVRLWLKGAAETMKIRTIFYTRIVVGAAVTASLATYLIAAWHHESRDKAVATIGSLAAAAAENLNRHIADTESILRLIAQRPPVRRLDPVSCDDGMRLIYESDPAHASISIADATGRVVCAIGTSGLSEPITFSDREWFQRVIADNRFIASKPYIGRLSGRLVTVFAYPIRDEQGDVIGSIQLSHALNQLRPIFGAGVLPSDTRITVVERDGIVISRYPETDQVGRFVGDLPIFRQAIATKSGTGVGRRGDGVEVIFGHATIPRADWIAVISQPVDTVMGPTRARSQWALAIAASLIVALAFAAAFFMRWFTRQTDAAVRTVRAIAAGDSKARLIEPALDEFAMIARNFNQMLDVREEAENRIHKLNRLYSALSETNHVITQNVDRQKMIDSVCRVAAERCGFSLVWIGFVDPRTQQVIPAACFGPDAGFVANIHASADPQAPGGNGPIAQALREAKLQIVSDIAVDERTARWRDEMPDGFRSIGVFPLTDSGTTIGVMCLYSAEPHYFDDPELTKLVGEIAADLSFGLATLKRDEIRRETEQRFRQIAETIREVFWLTDPTKNKVLYISPAYNEIWGRSAQELYTSPRNWVEAIHSDDRERVLFDAQTKQVAGDYDEQYRIVRSDGTIRWIHDRAFPIRDGQGHVFRIAGLAEDITERKATEDARRRSEATLAAAQGLAELGSWERNLRSIEITWSDEMFRLFNRDPALGPPSFDKFLELIDPADRPRLMARYQRAHETTQEVHVEYRTNRALGPVRHLRSGLAPIEDDAGTIVGFRGIVLDITKIKDTEARLFQSQKMEALGNLAGGIAHDFNNMLQPIINLTELSKDEFPADHPVQENLAMVIEAAMRARHLVRQILAFGRRSEHKLQNVDIASCIGAALGLLRNTLPSTILLVDQIEADAGIVEADPAELHSIILNLGANASQAMHGIGRLTLSVSRVGVTDPDLSERSDSSADVRFAKISISDSGHGMDADTISKIFNPFFTTKPVGEGTGLGLAMVHGILESLGGFIKVASEVDVGTTFTIYLPLIPGEPLNA